ncbi:MAG: histidine phosphatase family protein [Proteobacteria bacterium]|nr:histidine phosphatase family protein [Pseudomonadota bacterium]
MILLIRHGETTGNRKDVILGQKDYPLTEKGINSSERLAGLVSQYNNGIILTSPLGRAQATATIFSNRTGWPIFIVEGMIELSCGEWEGMSRKDVAPERLFLRTTWTDTPPGGECYKEAETRVGSVINAIREIKEYETFAVIGHASVNRVFLKLWLGFEPSQAMTVGQHHETIYLLGNNGKTDWINIRGERGVEHFDGNMLPP